MTRTFIISLAIATLALTGPVAADCVAEYKAKRDNPLRLNFGTAKLSDGACMNEAAATEELTKLLKHDGWTLLAIISLHQSGN